MGLDKREEAMSMTKTYRQYEEKIA